MQDDLDADNGKEELRKVGLAWGRGSRGWDCEQAWDIGLDMGSAEKVRA